MTAVSAAHDATPSGLKHLLTAQTLMPATNCGCPNVICDLPHSPTAEQVCPCEEDEESRSIKAVFADIKAKIASGPDNEKDLSMTRLQCTKAVMIIRECTKNDLTLPDWKLLGYIIKYVSVDEDALFSVCTLTERCDLVVDQLTERLATGQAWVIWKTLILTKVVAIAASSTVLAQKLYATGLFTKQHMHALWEELQHTRQYNIMGDVLPSALMKHAKACAAGTYQVAEEQFALNPTDAPRLARDVPEARELWNWCGYSLQKAATFTEAMVEYSAAFADQVSLWPSPTLKLPKEREDMQAMCDATLKTFTILASEPSVKPPAKAVAVVTEVRQIRIYEMRSLYVVSVNLLACCWANALEEAYPLMEDALKTINEEKEQATAATTFSAHARNTTSEWFRMVLNFNHAVDKARDYIERLPVKNTALRLNRNLFRPFADLPVARMVDKVVAEEDGEVSVQDVVGLFQSFFARREDAQLDDDACMSDLCNNVGSCDATAPSAENLSGHLGLFALQLLFREVSHAVAVFFTSSDVVPQQLKNANAKLEHLGRQLQGKSEDGKTIGSPITSDCASPLSFSASHPGLSTDSGSVTGSRPGTLRTNSMALDDSAQTLGTRTFVIRRNNGTATLKSGKPSAADSALQSSSELERITSKTDSDTVEAFPSLASTAETDHYLQLFLERDDVVVVCNEPCSSQDSITLAERFQVIADRPLGSGSYGKVRQAWDELVGCYLAAKELPIGSKGDQNMEAAREFLREYTTLTALNHPNIVRVIAFMLTGNTGQIFMEWVPSGSLYDVIRNHPRGALREGVVSRFAYDALAGLAYLHSQNVIHRDVKTANMLLSAKGTVKLTDFGTSIVTTKAEGSLESSAVMGTVAYMDPESTQGSYSAACDVWAFGCCVVEMITGATPWTDLFTGSRMETVPLLFRIGGLDEDENLERPHTQLLEADARLAAGESFADVDAPVRRVHPLSEELKDFLEQIFVLESAKRPTATELLTHPFIQTHLTQREERCRAVARAAEEANAI